MATWTARPRSSPRTRTLLIILGVMTLWSRGGTLAGSADEALPFSTSYLVTGNYAVGGVDLAPGRAAGGFVTGTIPMSGVPANADVVAAFLFWETISSDASQRQGARFRGEPLTVVKVSQQPLDAGYAPCWTSGGAGPSTMTMHRADVRRLLPVQLDAKGLPTGKRLVNSADLAAAGFAPHTVTLPESGAANQTPHSGGASLVVVYRDPAQPLTKVVLYDGIHIQGAGSAATQRIRGFLQSSASPAAKLTHIVGSGAENLTDRLHFSSNGATSLLAANAFAATAGSASERGWSNPTFDVGSALPGADVGGGYGEEVSTSVDHGTTTPYDCLAWAAIVFSTTVRDIDHDGLIDALEDVSGLKEPDGEALPDIHAMGAGSDKRDLFVEVNAMRAAPGTSYGSARAPFAGRIDADPTNDAVTDPRGHDHMPTPDELKRVGDLFASAPSDATGAGPGIRFHADVGPDYHARGGPYASATADAYLVPASLARGGESILETACVEDLSASPRKVCLFPDYPGTVGWKVGFQLYRDARIDATGRRRFDHDRRDIFHYGLYAHAGGTPRSPLACLDANGKPTAGVAPLESGHPCGASLADNPAFRVPSSSSGRGDLPGGDFMVSLGLWDTETFRGSSFTIASTTAHELGHNAERWHGGEPPALRTVTVDGRARLDVTFQANCKPNYQSVMSYLFQVNGLVDDDGGRHIDYSATTLTPPIVETRLTFGSLPVPLPYRASWFAPLLPGTLGFALGAKPVTKYCSGQAFPDPLPPDWIPFTRIDAASRDELLDWNADGLVNETSQDVNFDGSPYGTDLPPVVSPGLDGSNDWANLHLNQVGARRNLAGFSAGFLGGYVDGGYVDGGYVDGGYVDGGYVDGGYVDGGYVDGGYVDGGYVDGGYVDGGYVDGGYVDGGVYGELELSFELASDLWGYAPPADLRACVIDGATCLSPTGAPSIGHVRIDWTLPHAGEPDRFLVYRVDGDRVVPTSVLMAVQPTAGVPTVPGQTAYTAVDSEELVNGRSYTYLAKALFPDGADDGTEPELSIASNAATVMAVSRAPAVVVTPGASASATGWFRMTPLPVTVTATDDFRVAALSCTDGGTPVVGALTGIGTPSATLTATVSGDGVHALTCIAADGVGQAATVATTLRIDTVGPVTSFTSVPATGVPPTVSFTATDATSGVASFECRWDAGPFVPCTSPVTVSSPPAGTTFSVRAIDVAGNVGQAAVRTFSIGFAVSPSPIETKSPAHLGSAVPIAFQVRHSDGALVTSTGVVSRIESVYQGQSCPAGSTAAGVPELIYRNPDFSTGKSSLRFVDSSKRLQFNWDSTSAREAPTATGKGCYVVLIYLSDGAAPWRTNPIVLK